MANTCAHNSQLPVPGCWCTGEAACVLSGNLLIGVPWVRVALPRIPPLCEETTSALRSTRTDDRRSSGPFSCVWLGYPGSPVSLKDIGRYQKVQPTSRKATQYAVYKTKQHEMTGSTQVTDRPRTMQFDKDRQLSSHAMTLKDWRLTIPGSSWTNISGQ